MIRRIHSLTVYTERDLRGMRDLHIAYQRGTISDDDRSWSGNVIVEIDLELEERYGMPNQDDAPIRDVADMIWELRDAI